MHAVAAPAEMPAITRGRSASSGATVSHQPACHQHRLPPPANTIWSNGWERDRESGWGGAESVGAAPVIIVGCLGCQSSA
ncbi:hypothetical protein D3C87_1086270 [compost metagenome]